MKTPKTVSFLLMRMLWQRNSKLLRIPHLGFRDNGKENGNYYLICRGYIGAIMGNILGLYRDIGKEAGNYYRV